MRFLLTLILLPLLSVAQIISPISPKNGNPVKALPPGVDSIEIKYAHLMKIARKYGVAKNFTFKPSPTNPSARPPKRFISK